MYDYLILKIHTFQHKYVFSSTTKCAHHKFSNMAFDEGQLKWYNVQIETFS